MTRRSAILLLATLVSLAMRGAPAMTILHLWTLVP